MEHAKDYIEKSRQGIIAATEGLTEAQWNFKPSPECWSIAEILEHVAMTQELVAGPVWGRLASAPPAPADHDRDTIDAFIIAQFPNRSIGKFKGPEVLTPSGRATPAESIERLNRSCARLADLLDSTPDLREHALDSPPLKAISQGKYQLIDGYQLMLAMAGHAERHTRQMLEVKADAHYPAHAASPAVA
jgi:DinB superfamily